MKKTKIFLATIICMTLALAILLNPDRNINNQNEVREENVQKSVEEMDFMELKQYHLPDDVEYTYSRSSNYWIAKESNSTKYIVFQKRKKITSFDVGESLVLYGPGSIALGEKTHKVYTLFYVSSPEFKINIIEIDLDEEVSEVGNPVIYEGMMHPLEEIYPKLIGDSHYEWLKLDYPTQHKIGFPTIHMANGESYYVIPQKEEWMRLNRVPEDDNVSCDNFDSISIELFK